MSSAFIPLAQFMRRSEGEPASESSPPLLPATVEPSFRPSEDALRDARRFRAALSDALEAAVAELLPEIARVVVARELQLGCADVAAIAADAAARCTAGIVTLHVHPDDCAALAASEFTLAPDETLVRGDVIVELHHGTIDRRLHSRLDEVLAAWTA
jgi:flagellar biosynthesis/type III secretory pathway protein FliH